MDHHPGAGVVWSMGETPVVIPGIREFTLPPSLYEQVDVTHLESLAGEYLSAAIPEHEQATLTIDWDHSEAAHKALLDAEGTKQTFTVDFPGTGSPAYSFDANVERIAPNSLAPKGYLQMVVTLKVTGLVTIGDTV